MYGLAVDDWRSLIAVPHVAGDGHIVLTALNGLPVLPAARIYRLTAVISPGMETEVILGVFEATGLSGSTLTGVTASSGYADVNLSAGVTVEIRVSKATITELQTSLDTISSNFNSQVVHVTGNETIAGTKTFTSPILGTVVGVALDNSVVHVAGNETISGIKTFTTTIVANVTGNAGTVTNGVYTFGIYNDPTWITGLSGAKITGNISGFAGGLTASIAESQVTNLVTDLVTINTSLGNKANNTTVVHLLGNETISGIKTFNSPIIGVVAGMAFDIMVVHVAGNETIDGIKTFSSLINGNISGNAATVTNGVTTIGVYNNPPWITGLDGTKIIGNIGGNAAGLTNNISESQVNNLIGDLALKAPIASPTLTGIPTAPTAPTGTNTIQVATTEFVQAAIGGVGAGSVISVFGRSGTVGAAIGDYNVSQVTGAAPLVSPGFVGVPTAPTAIAGTNTIQIATTAFVQAALGGVGGGSVVSVFGRSGGVTANTGDYTVSQVTGAAPLASPTFTGIITLGTLTGLLKATTGVVSVATAGTDYLAPNGSGAALTGITGTQITGNITGLAGGLTANIPESRVTNLVSDLSTITTNLNTKANDTSTVHLSGNETIGGIKTFSSLISGSISGNSATVTNGVVTVGLYNDPTWIIGLSGSKISGNITGNAAGLTSNITQSQVTNLVSDLNTLTVGLASKAPLFSPAFTGMPTFAGSTNGNTGLRAMPSASGVLTLPSETDTLATQSYVMGRGFFSSLTGDVLATGPSTVATLANTLVTPGTYTNSNITVDSKGRITAASNGVGGGGGGGTPGGALGQVQYNSAGGFGGFGNWNGTTLLVSGIISATSFAGSGSAITGVVHTSGDEIVNGIKTFSNKTSLSSHVAPITTNPDSPTITLDCNLTDWHMVTLNGNRTLALVNDSTNQPITVILIQDNSGSRTIQWFNGIRWSNGVVPGLTLTPNKIDVFTFKKIAPGSYLGFQPGKNQ